MHRGELLLGASNRPFCSSGVRRPPTESSRVESASHGMCIKLRWKTKQSQPAVRFIHMPFWTLNGHAHPCECPRCWYVGGEKAAMARKLQWKMNIRVNKCWQNKICGTCTQHDRGGWMKYNGALHARCNGGWAMDASSVKPKTLMLADDISPDRIRIARRAAMRSPSRRLAHRLKCNAKPRLNLRGGSKTLPFGFLRARAALTKK